MSILPGRLAMGRILWANPSWLHFSGIYEINLNTIANELLEKSSLISWINIKSNTIRVIYGIECRLFVTPNFAGALPLVPRALPREGDRCLILISDLILNRPRSLVNLSAAFIFYSSETPRSYDRARCG